jgi:hypothetical protein
MEKADDLFDFRRIALGYSELSVAVVASSAKGVVCFVPKNADASTATRSDGGGTKRVARWKHVSFDGPMLHLGPGRPWTANEDANWVSFSMTYWRGSRSDPS